MFAALLLTSPALSSGAPAAPVESIRGRGLSERRRPDLVDRKDGGFDLQHDSRRGWELVKAFPWVTCDPAARAP